MPTSKVQPDTDPSLEKLSSPKTENTKQYVLTEGGDGSFSGRSTNNLLEGREKASGKQKAATYPRSARGKVKFFLDSINYLFFSYMRGFVSQACQKKEAVNQHQLPSFSPSEEQFDSMCLKLKSNFSYFQKQNSNYSFYLKPFKRFDCLFFLFSTFKRDIFIAIFLSIILVTSRNVLNLLLGELLSALLNRNSDQTFAIMIPFIICQLLSFFFDHHYFYYSSRLGLKIKLVTTRVLYEKLLSIDNSALRRENDAGKFVNMISNDLDALDGSIAYILGLVSAPVFLFISLYIMFAKIQASCLLGVLFMLLLFPTQKLIQNVKNFLNEKGKQKTDQRLGLLGELLENLKTVKMFVWEPFYQRKIEGLRKSEIKILRKVALCESFNFSILSSSVYIALFIILTTASYLNIEKKADQYVFTILGLLLDYRTFVVGPFTFGIGSLFDVRLVFSRIRELMELPNKNAEAKTLDNKNTSVFVRLKNVCSSYTNLEKENQLYNVNLDIASSGLNLILGPSGSGKTTLLKTILKEVPFMQGAMEISGKIAYVEQEPSLGDDTLQNNVTFGLPFNKSKYEAVLKACCLDKDVHKIPDGPLGMKGAKLSGGQRARVALARALYSDADIYLMDDPLSAIDARLTKAIFKNVFQAYLKGKTVFLATHHVKYSKKAQHLIVMFSGKIFAQGDFAILKRKKVDIFKCAMAADSKHPNIAYTQNFDFASRMSVFLNKEREPSSHSVFAFLPRNSVFSTIDEIYKKAEADLEKLSHRQRHSMMKFHKRKGHHRSLRPFGGGSFIKPHGQKSSLMLQIPSSSPPKNLAISQSTDSDSQAHSSKKTYKKHLLAERGSILNASGAQPVNAIKTSVFSKISKFDHEEKPLYDKSREQFEEEIKEVSVSCEASGVSSANNKFLEPSQGTNIREFSVQSSLKKRSPFQKDSEKKVSILVSDSSDLMQVPFVSPSKKLSVMSSASKDDELENEFENANQSVFEIEDEALSESSDSEGEAAREVCHRCQGCLQNIEGRKDDFEISWSTVRDVLSQGRLWIFLPLLMLLYVTAEFVCVFIFFSVSKMASEKIKDFNTSDFFNLLLILIVFYFFLIFAKAGFIFNFSASVCRALHSSLLKEVLTRKLCFFDRNSPGFILNNFSADMSSLAFSVPRWLIEFFDNFFMISGYMITIVLFDWAVIVPALILFYPLTFTKARVFPAINAAIKLESDFRFQLTNFFADSIGNLTSIRVYAQENYFQAKLFELLRHGFDACSTQFTSNRYLAFWLDLYTNTFSILTIIIFIGLKQNEPEYLGIMIIYIINLCGNLQWTIRCHIEAANSLSSLQKIKSTLGQTELSEPQGLDDESKAPGREIQGNIDFNNVSLRYNPKDLSKPPAVRDLRFSIKKGERLGCVGKSGAGKSTIVLGLMRFIEGDLGAGLNNEASEPREKIKRAEPCERAGRENEDDQAKTGIFLDGEDIRRLEPRKLRRIFGIMPQSPFLMTASVRENMDPFGEYSDEAVWQALEKAEIRALVEAFPQKLSQPITSECNLLSTGQKQMLNVARVLLKKAQIVVMDEATANIDIECDLRVQEILSTELPSSTFITIAHRINTIIDYDKILVLDKGNQVEFGHPFRLLAMNEEDNEITNQEGYFAQIIQALQEKEIVFNAAKKSYAGVDKMAIKKEVYERLKEEILKAEGQGESA